MIVETIQHLLLAGVPAYFYFVPELLFPLIYRRYLSSAVYGIDNDKSEAYEHIENLKRQVTRILRFIAFMSIVAVTVIATFYQKDHHVYFFNDCYLFASLIVVVGLAAWLIYQNFQLNFEINKVEEWLELIVVLLTVPVMYFWG